MLASLESDTESTPPVRLIDEVDIAELEKRVLIIASASHEKVCQKLRDRGYSKKVYIFKPEGRIGSAGRINKFAELKKAKKYLEVGVSQGVTFNNVSVDTKYAVDPKFRFTFPPDSPHIYEITSDDFFTNTPDIKFDIIFIDGLHHFEQAFRDFCNSLMFAHDDTIWLIDDTVPRDIYSAGRDQLGSVGLRAKEIGGSEKAWHGDVYKTVFAIRDFFPVLSYCTIIGPGNPQTLVWKSPRKNFTPLFNSLEAIERMDYYQFLSLKEEMIPVSEEEAYELLP